MKKTISIFLLLLFAVTALATDPQDVTENKYDRLSVGYDRSKMVNYIKYGQYTVYNKTLNDLIVADSLVFTKTSAATSGTVKGAYFTVTQTGAGAITEGLYSQVIANVHTGSWVNGIVGRVDYSTGSTGDASGGMAAAICAELNLPARTPAGGTYTCMDLELEAPENYSSITNPTAFPVSFMRMGLWGNATATDNWQDYGYIFHLADLDDATGNVFYDNTFRILINGTSWYIPLSDAEGEYSSAYQIDISNATDASSTTTGSIQTDGGLGVAKKVYVGTDLNVAGNSTFTGNVISNGHGATLVTDTEVTEVNYTGIVHQTVFTFASDTVNIMDHGVNGAHGKKLLMTFPAGIIKVIGAVSDIAVTCGTSGLTATATYDYALGSDAAGIDNSALAANEQDILTVVEGDLSSSAADWNGYDVTDLGLDGHTTPETCYLNIAFEQDDASANDVATITGTIRITWTNLGDY